MSDRFAIELPPALRGAGSVEVALILGSGLSDLADVIESPTIISFADIEGFPRAERNVVGHRGQLVVGRLGGKRVVAFQGRIHCYQGFSATEVSFPVRLAAAMGAETLVVTNAAGGIAPELAVGDLVLISDHVNLMGDNPLKGWPGPEGGNPFIPMRDAYDPELRGAGARRGCRDGRPAGRRGRVLRASRPELRDTRRGGHVARSRGGYRRACRRSPKSSRPRALGHAGSGALAGDQCGGRHQAVPTPRFWRPAGSRQSACRRSHLLYF